MLWNDDYKTGIKEIDVQHIGWLSIVENALNIALTNKTNKDVIMVLTDAKNYTEKHFLYEENLLRQNNYPDLQNHIHLHTKMTSYLKNMLKQANNEEYSNAKIIEMCELFLHWLIRHIEQEDKKYAPFCMFDASISQK